MSRTLEQAIASYEKSAERYHKSFLHCKSHDGEFYQEEAESNKICYEHDRQLAAWLKILKSAQFEYHEAWRIITHPTPDVTYADKDRAQMILDTFRDSLGRMDEPERRTNGQIKIERSIKGLSEWQMHVQAESDIDTNISTAIEALNAQLSQEGTTKDAISRQAAIDALQKCRKHCIDPFDSYHIDIQDAENQLSKVPTIQPEPKEGYWIRRDCGLDIECKCSVCGYKDFVEPHDTYWFKRNYCPNCGAHMKGATT